MIGRPKAGFVVQGVEHYLKRISGLAPVKLVPVKAEPMTKSSNNGLVKAAEAQRLLARVGGNSLIVALDPEGESLDSPGLAARLGRWQASGKSRLSVIIGGPLGLSDKVIRRADCRLSLSPMTFTHELTLLVWLEQYYRALSIRAGLPYAK